MITKEIHEDEKILYCSPVIREKFQPKQQLRCLFCRGKNCKNCGENAYLKQANPAIPGLHSSWITDSILAMQRPNDKILEKGILQEFINNKISVIFNLTEPGEHPFCGCQELNESSGFSYVPEKLMAAGINHFNYSWPDMTAPKLSLLKDIILVACNELDRGNKIAVHCHAGYGRTGIVIACILIVRQSMTSADAIAHVRDKRKGSVQTTTQQNFVHNFYFEYQKMCRLYPDTNDDTKTISQSISDQVFTLTSKEYANHIYRHNHKILIIIITTLMTYINNGSNLSDLFRAFTCLSSSSPSSSSLSDEEMSSLITLKTQMNSNNWTMFSTLANSVSNSNVGSDKTDDPLSSLSSSSLLMIFCQLLLDFLDTRSDCIWDNDMIENMRLIINNNIITINKTFDDSNSGANDDSLVYQLLVQSIERSMEKCKLMMLSQLVSILVLIYDANTNSDNNYMSLLVILRIAYSLCNGHKSTPAMMIERAIDTSIASTIINTTTTTAITGTNSDIIISFRVMLLLVRNKWTYTNSTNRIGWKNV